MRNEDDGVEHLDRALRLEQEVLAQMRALLAELPEDDPFRAVLERHRGSLEEAVSQIETLVEGTRRSRR
ncbi:MAG TPA: hypothetical protein VFA92_08930 [Candidatus Binatia bacterium]|jgi:hypothetical protein|nr:hypothetical protein [Candidatus Binatia bacterium]